jgi:hypothetical protein
MEPEPGNPQEIEGVLNPASIRGQDGALYVFPRMVARGNYSRIGIARIQFKEAGDPVCVERRLRLTFGSSWLQRWHVRTTSSWAETCDGSGVSPPSAESTRG